MSHGIAKPPSLSSRALHGRGWMNGARRSVKACAARPIARISHPFFSGLVRRMFLMGGGSLLFAGGLFAGHFAATAWPGPGDWLGSDKPLEKVVLEKLKSELQLTPAQTLEIEPIVAASCANLRMLSEERRARRLAILDEIGTTIAPDLTDDQRQRLDALEAQWQNRPPAKRDERIVALY